MIKNYVMKTFDITGITPISGVSPGEIKLDQDKKLNKVIIGNLKQGYAVRLYQMIVLKEFYEHVRLWRSTYGPTREVVCVFTKIRTED